MHTWIPFFIFFAALLAIIKGGDLFVNAATWIAKVSGVPQFLIGATIVSLATTLPEMIVSIIAVRHGEIEIGIGNAVGSVTANTGLILSIALLCTTIPIRRKTYDKKSFLLIAACGILFLACLPGYFQMWGSIVLLLIFLASVHDNIKHAKSEVPSPSVTLPASGQWAPNIVKFVLGAALIVVGSHLLVSSGSTIATMMGVPDRIIAVTMVAIGTSLPELVTTITSVLKKQASLSLGNIIGANLIDLSLILPICSFVSKTPLPISRQSVFLDIPVCLLILLIAIVPMLIKKRSYRWQGFVLIAVYAGYLISMIVHHAI